VKQVRLVDARASVRMTAALAGLVILGMGLVLFAWLSGKWTRRFMQSTPSSLRESANHARDDWADKPLTAEERHRLFRRDPA
jgi:hypothetical protein